MHAVLSPNMWNNGRATHVLSPRRDLHPSAILIITLMIEYCDVRTAFGKAVVPDVYKMNASSLTFLMSFISLTGAESKSVSKSGNNLSSGRPKDCANDFDSELIPFVS